MRTLHPKRNWLLSTYARTTFYILFILIGLGLGGETFAQGIVDSSISINMSPKNPEPKDEVLLTLKSFSTDLNQASVSWYVNGALKKQAKGLTSYSLSAGSFGEITRVEAVIATKESSTITKSVTIAPALVEILFQADSFVPPFYKGKALPGPGSTVTLVALPSLFASNGSKISPQSLVYTWKKNSTVLGSLSGLGKNTLTTTLSKLPGDSTTYSVEVTSSANGLTATQSISLEPKTPKILFYEDNPLLGVNLNKALGATYTLDQDELSLVAYPFSFKDISRSSFVWTINGVAVEGTGAPYMLTVRRPASGSGSSLLSISGSGEALFERTSQKINLEFKDLNSGL